MRSVGARALLAGLIALTLTGVGPSSRACAQDVEVLPPPVSVPLHSADDAHARDAGRSGRGRIPTLRVQPYRTPDPEGLRQWRELLRQSPHVLPPAPGFVEDRARGNGE